MSDQTLIQMRLAELLDDPRAERFPAPMTATQEQDYRDLFTAVNGRLLVEHGLTLVPFNPDLAPYTDPETDQPSNGILVRAGDMGALKIVAGFLGMNLSVF